jgi:hypothetical protein
MPLIADIKKDIQAARQVRLPWWGVLCWMAGCALLVWPLVKLRRLDLALPILNCVAVLGFAIALKRKLSRHMWFWITMSVIAVLHVPLIMFVPWTTMWVPAIAIAAIDSADLIAIITLVSVIQRFMEGPTASET